MSKVYKVLLTIVVIGLSGCGSESGSTGETVVGKGPVEAQKTTSLLSKENYIALAQMKYFNTLSSKSLKKEEGEADFTGASKGKYLDVYVDYKSLGKKRVLYKMILSSGDDFITLVRGGETISISLVQGSSTVATSEMSYEAFEKFTVIKN